MTPSELEARVQRDLGMEDALGTWLATQFQQEDGVPKSINDEFGVPYVTVAGYHVGSEDRTSDLVLWFQEKLSALHGLGARRLVWRKRPHIEFSDEDQRTLIRARLIAVDADGRLVPFGTDAPSLRDVVEPALDLRDAVRAPEVPAGPVGGYDVVTADDAAVLLCARILHSAVEALNAEYNETTLTWEQSRESCVAGVRRVLANPAETAEENHAAWIAYRESEGWRYGPIKDAELKTHPLMVPFSALGPHARSKDAIFLAVVRAFFGIGS